MNWILFQPTPYYQGVNMTRDLGALTTGLRMIGDTPRYFLIESRISVTDECVNAISEDNASNPTWWASQEGDAVIMMFGGIRHIKYYKAIKDAGKKLLFRMDTSGILSPSQDFKSYSHGRAIYQIDQFLPKFKFFSVPLAYIHAYLLSGIKLTFKKITDSKLCAVLAYADQILIDYPGAIQKLALFLNLNGFSKLIQKLKHLPPAICPTVSPCFDIKCNQIISVGNWNYYVKNPKLLVKTLELTLSSKKHWSAVIVGPGHQKIKQLLEIMNPACTDRIRVFPSRRREELDRLYAESKILLCTSHKEGFPNVVAESACFGCSSVGRNELPAFQHLSELGACTLSDSYSPFGFTLAVTNEITLWDSGQRSASDLSSYAMASYPADVVATKLKHILLKDNEL